MPDPTHAPRAGDPVDQPMRFGTGPLDTHPGMEGRTLADRYKIVRPIGSGGMGTVYLAEHVVINKPVAIKVLSPSHSRKKAEVERFLFEARAASRIRHEHIVDITDFGHTRDGLAFLVMEYLEGEDLATTSDREGVLPWRRAAKIARQIAEALQAAHAQGVIHRDMKPENCFRVRRGSDPDFIKVLDFGIAKIIDEEYDPDQPSSTASGLLGTPEYVAPELVRGLKPDARVDIYAVGVIFYRLLTGRVPFAGESFMATLTAHLMETPKPPRQVNPGAEIPTEIEHVVLRALVKDRDFRYQSIEQFLAGLAKAEAAITEAATVLPPPPTAPDEQRGIQPRVLLAVVVALILVFAAVLWYVVQSLRAEGQVAPPPVVEARAEPPAAAPATPEPAAPVPAPEPAPPVEPAPAPPEALDPAPEVAAADEPEETELEGDRPQTASKKPAAKSVLPERLSTGEFASAMTKVAGRVQKECSKYALRKMEVTVEVSVGPDGRVKSASPAGSQAGSSLGNCVAKVVKSARLKPARSKSSHRHTFKM